MAYVAPPTSSAIDAYDRWTEFFMIPHGKWGIEATVRRMRRLARGDLRTVLLQDTAADIVRSATSSYEAAIDVRRFLERHTRFAFDPEGVELIRSPVYMLRAIEIDGVAAGDCDDVAVLGAALGLAAGLPARFVLLGFTQFGPFEHVYTELITDGGAVELDTTRPAQLPPDIQILQVGHRGV